MKKAVKYTVKVLAVILLLPLLYLLVAFIASVIPVNPNSEAATADVEIFLRTNGVHTSIVVPVKNEVMDWTEVVDYEHTLSNRSDFNYVSFGWGDLTFYRNTPEWSDLTPKIAFKALFLKTPSALNIEFHQLIVEDENTVSVDITTEQYRKLAQYIRNSFEYDQQGNAQQVPDLHYNRKDAFYRARRHLNLFYTCNTWTNNALKNSDLRACLWTPFDKGVFYHYD